MRIKKIIFKNFRQLRDTALNFEKNSGHDIHIVIGKNGTGKTNILNAVNWCFYNDEPNLTIEQQRLPILTRSEINNSQREGESKEVSIEIFMESENSDYIFKRKQFFKVYKETRRAIPQYTEFEIVIIDKINDESKIFTLNGQSAEDFMENLIPKSVRDFYFFDGERLDNYFKEATSKNIQHSIFILSQIELLERLEKRFISIFKEFANKAKDYNPKIEKINNDIKENENKIEEQIKEIKECEIEIKKAKNFLDSCNDKLKSLPDTKVLELKREYLISQKKIKNDNLKFKMKEKENILFYEGIKIMLGKAIINTIDIIKKKRDRNEIPPSISDEILEEIIKTNYCNLCRRPLDKGSSDEIKKIIKERKLLSEVGHKLESIEHSLYSFEKDFNAYLDDINHLSLDIQDYEKDITIINDEIVEIDKKVTGYNISDINKMIELRIFNDKVFVEKNQYLGVLKNRLNKLEIEKTLLDRMLNDEIKKEDKISELRKKIFFVKKSLEIIKESKDKLITDTRKEIGDITKEIFLELLWKKGDFKDVLIDENYNLNLIDLFGQPCLGAISRAEKLLLSLSFTLALHRVSGFNSSFIIDTPVSPTDDLNRENLGNIFAKLSKEKQIVLLFIPTEYSIEISKTLDLIASTKYFTDFDKETKETKLVEVKNG